MSASDDPARAELGVLLSRLLGVVLEREAPILEAHRVTMWEYVILSCLLDEPGLTQKELAGRTRRDPTRLIGHLDALADRGLVEREVDQGDRRRRTVRLTEGGSRLVRGARRDIRRMEDDLLGGLSAREQLDLRGSLAAILTRDGA
jgi:DNA-binding MarR family transcriptional regulator